MGVGRGERGQAHTLEAVVGALLLLTGLVFALQTTAVTPLSASTASQHIENQQEAMAQGLLASAAREDALKDAVLYWNETADRFHNASRAYYTHGGPPNRFGVMLNQTFADEGMAFNVYLSYQRKSGDIRRTRLVYMGGPSDNAVQAARTVTLYDDDHLVEWDESRDGSHTVNGTSGFYAPKVTGPGSGLYNVVRVEVVVWRM